MPYPLLGMALMTALGGASAPAQPAPLHHVALPAHARIHPMDWRRSPYSSGAIQARLLHAGVIHPRSGPRRVGVFPNLTCSPAPCVFPNSQASEGGQPVNETPISINPKNGQQILTAGNDYNCSQSLQGYFLSTDGGSTWNRTCGSLASGAFGGDGDPIVAWDRKGTAYRGGIDTLSTGHFGIVVDHSTDGGKTWSTPVVAVPAEFSGGDTDKPWMEIDDNKGNSKGEIYVSATQFDSSNNSDITVSHSTDGGATWSEVSVGAFSTYPTVSQFSDLAIARDGTVYVSWMQCTASGSAGDCGGTQATMLMSRSTDGGKTWSSPATINTVTLVPDFCGCAFYGSLPNTFERVSNIPVIAVDTTKKATQNTLYVVEYTWTGTYMMVQVLSSTNGGSKWSKPKPVAPASDNHDQFFPWINVNQNGIIGVTWLDRRNDPNNVNYEAFAGVSREPHHFKNYDLSAHPSNPFNDGFGGGFMGDYTGNDWTGKSLYASWTDTSNGSTGQDVVGGLLK